MEEKEGLVSWDALVFMVSLMFPSFLSMEHTWESLVPPCQPATPSSGSPRLSLVTFISGPLAGASAVVSQARMFLALLVSASFWGGHMSASCVVIYLPSVCPCSEWSCLSFPLHHIRLCLSWVCTQGFAKDPGAPFCDNPSVVTIEGMVYVRFDFTVSLVCFHKAVATVWLRHSKAHGLPIIISQVWSVWSFVMWIGAGALNKKAWRREVFYFPSAFHYVGMWHLAHGYQTPLSCSWTPHIHSCQKKIPIMYKLLTLYSGCWKQNEVNSQDGVPELAGILKLF